MPPSFLGLHFIVGLLINLILNFSKMFLTSLYRLICGSTLTEPNSLYYALREWKLIVESRNCAAHRPATALNIILFESWYKQIA